MIGYFVTLAVAFAFGAIVLSTCERHCPHSKTIVNVGGCAANGECGVRFSDGTMGTSRLPVVGQAIDVYGGCP